METLSPPQEHEDKRRLQDQTHLNTGQMQPDLHEATLSSCQLQHATGSFGQPPPAAPLYGQSRQPFVCSGTEMLETQLSFCSVAESDEPGTPAEEHRNQIRGDCDLVRMYGLFMSSEKMDRPEHASVAQSGPGGLPKAQSLPPEQAQHPWSGVSVPSVYHIQQLVSLPEGPEPCAFNADKSVAWEGQGPQPHEAGLQSRLARTQMSADLARMTPAGNARTVPEGAELDSRTSFSMHGTPTVHQSSGSRFSPEGDEGRGSLLCAGVPAVYPANRLLLLPVMEEQQGVLPWAGSPPRHRPLDYGLEERGDADGTECISKGDRLGASESGPVRLGEWEPHEQGCQVRNNGKDEKSSPEARIGQRGMVGALFEGSGVADSRACPTGQIGMPSGASDPMLSGASDPMLSGASDPMPSGKSAPCLRAGHVAIPCHQAERSGEDKPEEEQGRPACNAATTAAAADARADTEGGAAAVPDAGADAQASAEDPEEGCAAFEASRPTQSDSGTSAPLPESLQLTPSASAFLSPPPKLPARTDSSPTSSSPRVRPPRRNLMQFSNARYLSRGTSATELGYPAGLPPAPQSPATARKPPRRENSLSGQIQTLKSPGCSSMDWYSDGIALRRAGSKDHAMAALQQMQASGTRRARQEQAASAGGAPLVSAGSGDLYIRKGRRASRPVAMLEVRSQEHSVGGPMRPSRKGLHKQTGSETCLEQFALPGPDARPGLGDQSLVGYEFARGQNVSKLLLGSRVREQGAVEELKEATLGPPLGSLNTFLVQGRVHSDQEVELCDVDAAGNDEASAGSSTRQEEVRRSHRNSEACASGAGQKSATSASPLCAMSAGPASAMSAAPASATPAGPASARSAGLASATPAGFSGRFQGQRRLEFGTESPRSQLPRLTEAILGIAYADVAQRYAMHKDRLGKGQFGIVRRCIDIETGQTYACKTIPKAKIRCAADAADIRREVTCLTLLRDHPTVVGLKDMFEDEHSIHLIMDLCQGGDLFERIQAQGVLSEAEAAEVCRALVEALLHCHCMGIMHRDVKPENILMTSKESNTSIKLIDFGIAAFFKQGVEMDEKIGTWEYMAPERLNGSYGPKADIWSAGAVLYAMLSSVHPFWASSRLKVVERIQREEPSFKSARWTKISELCKDLIRRMLANDPTWRLSADQVLSHPWIVQLTSQ